MKALIRVLFNDFGNTLFTLLLLLTVALVVFTNVFSFA
ncbi:hypothetical protein OKW21_003583 [Catalinimonas alkaloidigena]|nr:hypothetical protein [Catalinimonas alkaloidigena]